MCNVIKLNVPLNPFIRISELTTDAKYRALHDTMLISFHFELCW